MSEVILLLLFGVVLLFIVFAPLRGDSSDRRVTPH